MTAEHIKDLLAEKHAKDVFVPECKDGPTQARNHVRLDAWAMTKSWAHPLTIGYEIKVSKKDFKQDDKWHKYLKLCNQLFFICPRGLIQPNEMPGDVGLLHVAGTGNRLLTVKKAAHREQGWDPDLTRYILMCRARIGPETDDGTPNFRRQRIKKWLAEKEADRKLGYEVGRSVARIVDQVRQGNEVLKKENEAAKLVLDTAKRLGVDMGRWDAQYPEGCERKMKEALAVVPAELREWLTHLKSSSSEALYKLAQMEATASTPARSRVDAPVPSTDSL